MIFQIFPSISMWVPFLNWFVEITAANPREPSPTAPTSRFARPGRWVRMAREDLEFHARGAPCAAWLYPPAGDAARAPLVVMAHGLSGTRRDRLGPFAERFAAAGVA